jgi:acyl-CoA reductase-like NAD-dependent aldehyde dehydrogenase
VSTQSVDPRTGEAFGPLLEDTTAAELDLVVKAAVGAADAWARLDPPARASALRLVADALDGAGSGLIPLADRETGLGVARLTGELARTTFQLRMFADAVERGDQLGVIIDPAVPGPPPAGHPELRRMLVPIGPVAVYGASNFPFAFSVPGGDTAAALAAGCPVVVKAHPAHPQTSEAVAEVITNALSEAGAPSGTFGLVRGYEVGSLLVQHPGIRAAAFTGSYRGGRALFDLAAGRPDPIPFYGELGSVNPVVVTAAGAERGAALAAEYLESLTLGTGQFCTNPGLLLVPAGSGLTELIVTAAQGREPGVMLHSGVADLFRTNVSQLAGRPGVRTLVDESAAPLPGAHSGPVILVVDAVTAAADLELLHTECFGPAGLVIEYTSPDELFAVLAQLDGCLVATVHGSEDEALAEPLVRRLSALAGRVLWNGWPTGVAVTAGQQHGGPHPSTTSSLHTSVGTAAAQRFLRPVAFQAVPESLLPAALRQR